MKKFLIAILALIISTMQINVMAKVGEQVVDPGRIPKDVYQKPYADSLFTSVYTPWMKLFHITSVEEKENNTVGGEVCQQIMSVAVSPFDDNLVLMGTDTSGVWKSETGGDYWYSVGFSDMYFHSIQDIYFHPTDENTVYVVAADCNSTSAPKASEHDGIYRSRDKGETWEHVFHTLYSTRYFDKLLAHDKNGVLYAVSGGGVFKSMDDGDTWENAGLAFDENVTDGCARKICVSDDGNVILAAFGRNSKWNGVGLYYTLDAGKTWAKTAPEEGMSGATIDFDPRDENHWYASFIKADTMVTGMYESYDKGETWSLISELPVYPSISAFGPKNETGGYRYYIELSAITYPFRYSDDYGKTWTEAEFPHRSSLVWQNTTGFYSQGFSISKQNPNLVYAAQVGMCKSIDAGATFNRKSSGISGKNVAHIFFDKNNYMYLSCVDSGHCWSNGPYSEGEYPTFSQINDTYVNNVTTVDPNNNEHIISYCYSSWRQPETEKHLFQTWDRGKTFEIIDTGGPIPTQTFIEYDKENENIIYTNDYTSFDNGKTWQKNKESLMAICSYNQNVYYKMTGDKAEAEYWVSKDGGETWTFLGKPGFMPKSQISGGLLVYPDVNDSETLYVVGTYQMARLNTDGIKKFSMSKVEGVGGFWSFAQNPQNPKHMLAGTTGNNIARNPGLIESTDGGETWHAVPGLLGHRTPYNIQFHEDEVFVCTMSGIMIYNYNAFWDYLNSKITVLFNNNEISFSTMPQIVNNRAMVPMRELFEMLGATVSWDEETQTVEAKRKTQKVTLTLNSDTASINNKPVKLDSAPYIDDGKTMIPLRFASEALDINVGWDAEEKIIVIKE